MALKRNRDEIELAETPFFHEERFDDREYGEHPIHIRILNNNFNLNDTEKLCAQRCEPKWKCAEGIVTISRLKENQVEAASEGYEEEKLKYWMAFMDLHTFNLLAEDTAIRCDFLQSEAEGLIKRWRVTNQDNSMIGRRQPLQNSYTLCKQEWQVPQPNSRGTVTMRKHMSEYVLNLSTHKFTANNKSVKDPNLHEGMIDVNLKIKSTLHNKRKMGKTLAENMRYDGWQGCFPLPLFLKLLKSAEFQRQAARSRFYYNAVRHNEAIPTEDPIKHLHVVTFNEHGHQTTTGYSGQMDSYASVVARGANVKKNSNKKSAPSMVSLERSLTTVEEEEENVTEEDDSMHE